MKNSDTSVSGSLIWATLYISTTLSKISETLQRNRWKIVSL